MEHRIKVVRDYTLNCLLSELFSEYDFLKIRIICTFAANA